MKSLNPNFAFVLTSFFLLKIFFSSAQVEYFITINPATGVHTIIDSISGVDWIQAGPSCTTIDRANNRYFFRGLNNSNVGRLYTVNSTNGSVISNPFFPVNTNLTNVSCLQYDDSTSIIYGVGWDASLQKEYFLSVDPATSLITQINQIPGLVSISMGSNTYDQKKHHFYLIGADNLGFMRLYIIDALTGSVINNSIVNFSTTMSPTFNSFTGKLYAIDITTTPKKLVELDPLNGSFIATVATFSNFGGIVLGSMTDINTLNNSFTSLFYDSTNVIRCTTINLLTGSITSNPPLNLWAGENIIEIKYNNSTGVLFGLHWGRVQATTTGIKHTIKETDIKVYPNPAANFCEIVLSEPSSNLHVDIFNSEGKLVKTQSCEQCLSIFINTETLTPGLYHVHIQDGAKSKRDKKIVVE